MRRFIVMTAFLAIFFGGMRFGVTQDSEKPATTRVKLGDVPERVEIVGRLGAPIGELVDVQGEWQASRAKPGEPLYFVVREVNGRAVDVAFGTLPADRVRCAGRKVEELQPREGDLWEMRGIEAFDYVGYPEAFWKELGLPLPAQRAHGFVSRFEYVRARVVAAAADKPASKP
jgi:hypothetical protein